MGDSRPLSVACARMWISWLVFALDTTREFKAAFSYLFVEEKPQLNAISPV